MTLPPFELHRPGSVEEALDLLDSLGDDAVVMQGGTELLLLLKLGLAEYGHIVDLKRIRELRGVTADNGRLRLGSGTTHLEIERSPAVRERWPSLIRMERMVANIRVRAAGTIGGNLAFSDPHSDPATFFLASGATIVLRSNAGERSVPIGDFVIGPYETALTPGELIVAIELPAPEEGTSVVHAKLAFHERPAVTVTCLARIVGGVVAEARLAVGSVGPVPGRAGEAERLLTGLPAEAPDEAVVALAAEAAAEHARITADANGSVDYKRALVATLVRRAFVAVCAGS